VLSCAIHGNETAPVEIVDRLVLFHRAPLLLKWINRTELQDLGQPIQRVAPFPQQLWVGEAREYGQRRRSGVPAPAGGVDGRGVSGGQFARPDERYAVSLR
jgi:hypothetical protein